LNFLLDTSVLNALLPRSAGPLSETEAWFITHQHRCFLSPIVIAEISSGIAKLRREGGAVRAGLYDRWLHSLATDFSDRILPFDLSVARRTGELIDEAVSKGWSRGFPDIAIAATASVHQLMVLTRNLKHFAAFDIAVADPFSAPPR
jgi:toxin FitB